VEISLAIKTFSPKNKLKITKDTKRKKNENKKRHRETKKE